MIKTIAYVAVCAALLIYINIPTLRDYFETRERRDSYRDSVGRLKAEHDALLREEAELKRGGFAMEKAIRERMLMVQPGEEILFIEDAPNGAEGGRAAVKPILPGMPTAVD